MDRASGILLHFTSLWGKYGIGDLGRCAYDFADFLVESGQRYWQVLPVNPVRGECGWSPYNCDSAFAGCELLISPELLYEDGLLDKADLDTGGSFDENRVDYVKVHRFKERLFKRSWNIFCNKGDFDDFEKFCQSSNWWLDDYSLFTALRDRYNKIWYNWPKELRDRHKRSMVKARRELEGQLLFAKFKQYLFFDQYLRLKSYCNSRGVEIIGDIPIYVALGSSEVWANSKIFKLDREKKPKFCAGVPPDVFSSTGQLWGNPVYNWGALKRSGYQWWLGRLKHNLVLFDKVRIDHFRGFVAFWQVRAGEKTAVNGKWVKVDSVDFFGEVFSEISKDSIIVEDLGLITDDVRSVIEEFGLASMKVLLFGFNDMDGSNQYLPHNHIRNCVVYTGTHDNNTVRGWFENEVSRDVKAFTEAYFGKKLRAGSVSSDFVRMGMESVGNTAIFPLQDVAGIGSQGRMNKPSTVRGNWRWRCVERVIGGSAAIDLKRLCELGGRI